MQQNYTPDSFKKGQQFEDFVEKRIFTEDRYELITRTNSFEQNATRYAEDTMKPDFKFRCKETGREFWVEAKYRSDFFQDQIEAHSYRQRDRFYVLEKDEDIPVFVIIGYWGVAYKPNGLSLIPLKEYEYIPLYRSFLRRFEIPIGPVSNNILQLKEKNNKESDEKTQPQEEEKKSTSVNNLKNYNPKILSLASVGMLAIFMIIYSFAFSEESPVETPEEQLKEIVADYYQSMNSNQIEKLPEYLSLQVTGWYGEENPSREWIYRNAKAHRGKFPYSSSDIDWDSFKAIPLEAGGYHVTYEMIYKSKEKISDDYTVFNLKLITKWDDDLRIKSISEIRE